nr:CGNR zinc finger domain-containing protein [Streptomyces sp. SID8377]
MRRCANPECSMLFLAGNSRRKWCTGNICGNRTRVARHCRRSRAGGTAPG